MAGVEGCDTLVPEGGGRDRERDPSLFSVRSLDFDFDPPLRSGEERAFCSWLEGPAPVVPVDSGVDEEGKGGDVRLELRAVLDPGLGEWPALSVGQGEGEWE